ncbi:MAG: hypothetical protein K2X03_30830 [Bryobacteraceae bacterium]|nr:hypothetical protein [Bryobacteraceae bacterium]
MRFLERWMPLVLATLVTPVLSLAFSTGPPALRDNIPSDGGVSCTACHRAAASVNPDSLGRLSIQTSPYRPGVKQFIRLRLSHPEASRWGFELAARLVSDETKQAGTFTVVPGAVRVTCAPGNTPAPCNGEAEFATHVAASTFAGQREGAEWTIEWTPPATNVGEVIFYAVGNAANNNGANSGDFIYATTARVAADGTCLVTGRPTIRGVADAASGRANFFTMNGIFTIAGAGFHAATGTREAGVSDFVEGRFPTQLGCLAVEVAGQRVPVLFANAGQINAQMPTGAAPGNGAVVVILNPGGPNEARSDSSSFTVLANAPAFFTFNGSAIAARHPDFSIAGDPTIIPGARPVRPGDVVLLYATGLGPTNPVYQSGEVPGAIAPTREAVTVTIGGTTLAPADVLYAGVSPGSISGLYQINVRVPASTADGNAPVSLRIGGQSTQTSAVLPVRR